MNNILFLMLLLTMSLVPVITVALDTASEPFIFNEWINESVSEDEKLLCERTIKGDKFFVARSGNRLKVGYLIDVTSDMERPKTYIVSWGFLDESGQYLPQIGAPDDVRGGYIKHDSRVLAEDISYRSMDLSSVNQLEIVVELKKYGNVEKAPNSLDEVGHSEDLPEVKICSVQLAQTD